MTRDSKKPRGLLRFITPPSDAQDEPFWIGDSFVEPRLNQITCNGQTQQVERQVMRVLQFLAAHPDQPLSRDTILMNIWADGVPNDEGLTQAICKLRKALGDRPGEGNIIQTIRKVGYRLVAPVVPAHDAPFSKPISFSVIRRTNPSRRSVRIRVDGDWLAAAALVSITIFVISQTM